MTDNAVTNKADLPNNILVSLSKTRYLLVFLGAVLGLVGSVLLLSVHPEQIQQAGKFSPAFVRMVSILCLLFSFAVFAFALRVLLSQKPALILDQQGFTDRSNRLALGRIPWIDVKEITLKKVHWQHFLVIDLVDRDKYLKNAGRLQAMVMQSNLKTQGAPVYLPLNTFRADPEELYQQFSTLYAHAVVEQSS